MPVPPPPPPPSGWGAVPYAPPARPARRGPVVVVSLVAVAGLLLAAVVVSAGSSGIDHPDEWDERVVDLAAFVERERGLDFEHPVTVEFLTEDEYSERARVDEGMLTESDRADIEDSAAVFEALGLVPAGTDMLETSNEMADTGTLAFYDPMTESVSVRGTEMTTGLAVTLVHELVHVAQDQAFDLEAPPVDEDSAFEAYDALVEGDAVRVEMAYVESLSLDEQDTYWADYEEQYDESEADLSDVPGALQALFAAPYVLGQPVVDLIAADGGNSAVDDAFEDPPSSSEHLFDPRSYLDLDLPASVDQPELPRGADEIGESGPLGATTLFVMLAERIDPVTALGAADGWGGDMSVAYRDGDRVCVRVDLVGDTDTDTGEIAAALQGWVDAGSAGTASVEQGDDVVAFESCAGPPDGDGDGGGESSPAGEGASFDALALPASRSQIMVMATDGGLPTDDAFTVGDCFVHRVPLDTITLANESAEPPAEVMEAIDSAIVECMRG